MQDTIQTIVSGPGVNNTRIIEISEGILSMASINLESVYRVYLTTSPMNAILLVELTLISLGREIRLSSLLIGRVTTIPVASSSYTSFSGSLYVPPGSKLMLKCVTNAAGANTGDVTASIAMRSV